MFPRLAAVLIAFVLFGSAFASYGQACSEARLAQVQVEAILSADPAQRDDAGLAEQPHRDESTAASHIEGGGDFPEGLAPVVDPLGPAMPTARPRAPAATAWRAPTLDGLRRPPRGGLFAA